jgi:hypothetical protein
MTVDQFVKTRVLPQYRPIVRLLRQLMRDCAPQATEVMSYGIPAFRLERIIAVISPTKKGITLAFSRGAEFQDRYGLLEGVGRVSKNVRMRDVTGVNRTALRSYIKQAVAFDRRRGRGTGATA